MARKTSFDFDLHSITLVKNGREGRKRNYQTNPSGAIMADMRPPLRNFARPDRLTGV